LNDLPKTLDEIYGCTLLNIEEKREFAQRLFRCLAISIRPLRVDELAEIFAIQFDEAASPTFNAAWRPENAEEALISACSSLIAIIAREGHQVVQFSHFSVKEYLTSERLKTADEGLSYYHVLPESAHTTLAHAGLSVLLQLDDKIDRDTIAYFPLAPYAARHWVDHAHFSDVSSHIKDVMKRLFDPAKPHFAAWIWLYDIDRYWTERMPTMHPTQPDAMPLYYASLCGFVGLAEHLIAVHLWDVNSKGGCHTTPLHAASVKGHLQVASLLLRHGADPDSRDHLGRVPLHRVSHGGQLVMTKSSLEIARLLVNSGADVNATDDEGCAPLHAAAQSGYREIAELLLGSSASLEARNKEQQTPLNISCLNGKPDMAHFLIERGSDINSRDEDGLIPLHAASGFGHVDVARLLLDCSSDVNVRETRSRTPLHQASQFGYLDLARFLMDRGADVNAQKEDGGTALHLASNNGHLDIAKLLIDRGANVDYWNDKQRTPLALASYFGHLDTARFLIEKGAAVSAPDKEGDTPIHLAAFQGHLHVTKFFLECGVDVDIRNVYGVTSLYLA
jgi:ankyrin repeat protein